jgi:hypothetical protein
MQFAAEILGMVAKTSWTDQKYSVPNFHLSSWRKDFMNSKPSFSRLVAAGILAAAFSTSATAQTPIGNTGTITSIQSGWAGEGIYITLSSAPSPACNGRLFMPTSSIQYKENLALAMLALSQGLTITIYSSTTCDSTGNVALVSLSVS